MLAVTAALLCALWLWAWVGLDWPSPFPASSSTAAVPVALPAPSSPPGQPFHGVDAAALLERPVFYPDRRAHPFRGDAAEAQATPSTTLDFELTTTVVATNRRFAILRLRGGGNSVIARVGEAFEADPAWQVTHIDRTSVAFVNAQGVPLTLTVKPPAPASPSSTPVNTPGAHITAATPTSTQATAMPSPITATQPLQENADIRARIEARRRQANATTQADRTQ